MAAAVTKGSLVAGLQHTMEMYTMAEATALDEEVGSDSDDWATMILVD